MRDVIVHRSTERLPGDRGRGFGRAQRDRVRACWDAYRSLFALLAGVGDDDARRLGGSALASVAEWAPELAEEIDGIAAGAGLPVEALAAMNARTEILAAGRAPRE